MTLLPEVISSLPPKSDYEVRCPCILPDVAFVLRELSQDAVDLRHDAHTAVHASVRTRGDEGGDLKACPESAGSVSLDSSDLKVLERERNEEGRGIMYSGGN